MNLAQEVAWNPANVNIRIKDTTRDKIAKIVDWLPIGIMAINLAIVCTALFTKAIWGFYPLGILVLIATLCLEKIPETKVAMVLFLGARTTLVKAEGLRCKIPGILTFDLQAAVTDTRDYKDINVLLPDRTPMLVSIGLSIKTMRNRYLYNFYTQGKLDGVWQILKNQVQAECRIIFSDPSVAPADYEAALADQDGLQNRLKTRLCANGTVEAECGVWVFQLVFDNLEVDPNSAVGKAIENRAKETEEQAAETTEINHVKARVQDITTSLGIPTDRAIQIVQTERGKAEEKIHRVIGIRREPKPPRTGWVTRWLKRLI